MSSKEKVLKVRVPKTDYQRYKLNWEGNPRKIYIDFRCIHKNSFGTVNYGGRNKIKWKSPLELEAKVNEYFASCYGYLYDFKGKPIIDPDGNPRKGVIKPYTLSGLALYLGVDSKTLRTMNEGKIDALGIPTDEDYVGLTYAQIIKNARDRVQAYAEERLYDRDGFNGGRLVLDFAFGWGYRRELQEIKKMKKELEMREKELEMKQRQLELDENGEDDNSIDVVIHRAGED